MKTKVKMRRILTILLMILIVLVGGLYYLVTWKESYVIVKSIPASNTISRVTALEKTGGALELKSEDVNGLIETLMRKKFTMSGITVDKVFVEVDKGLLNIYAPASFKGMRLMLSCNGILGYKDEKIVFTPNTFKVGKVTISRSFIMSKITNFSSEDISISKENILIDKNAIPFGISNMSIKEDVISVAIDKLIVAVQNPENNTSTNNQAGGSTGGTVSTKEDILKKANSQLSGVYRDVKSTNNKNIITRIQSTVGKMIQNSSYNYSKDVEEVKAMKNGLTQVEKNELQDAILDNMSTSTIKQIRNTFGI